jgi:hypothetical protein
MATLLMVDLNPIGGSKFWSGNHIFTSISSRFPIHLDEGGCPMQTQPFPQATLLLRKLAPLWEYGIHNWAQIWCRGPADRPSFLKDKELQ